MLASYFYAFGSCALVYASFAFGMFTLATTIAVRGMLSGTVSAHEQATIFALVASIENVNPMIGGLAYSAIFRATQSFWPGLCFAVSALTLVVPLAIFLHLDLVGRREDSIWRGQMDAAERNVERACDEVDSITPKSIPVMLSPKVLPSVKRHDVGGQVMLKS